MPNQCKTSGISAWKRISLTPAIISVDLKYLSAESPPYLRKLYTGIYKFWFVKNEKEVSLPMDKTYLVTSLSALPSLRK